MNISVAQSTGVALTREVLTAARTYYVRTDGNDSNDGLSNTSGGAFLTIQRAVDEVANTLDINAQTVAIEVADGAYNAPVVLKPFLGTTVPTLRGNTATPANVTITLSTADCISATNSGPWHVEGFKLSVSSGSFNCIEVLGSYLTFASVNFGASSQHHVVCGRSAVVEATGNYDISGGALFHLSVQHNGIAILSTRTVTLSGTPAFTTGFAFSSSCSELLAKSMTFSGSATGARYAVTLNGVIDTGGGGANYFPGSSAGSAASGGQYA